jgi:hypothetical protein
LAAERVDSGQVAECVLSALRDQERDQEKANEADEDVALGRLENHFLACIINILGLPETTPLAKRFPVSFDQRAKIWSRAFAESPTLGAKQIEAQKFLAELDDVLNSNA